MPIIQIQSAANFEETAARVFAALSVEDYQLGNSDHYPGGFYYYGEIGTFEVEVYPADPADDACRDFQFQVYLGIDPSSPVDPGDAADLTVTELLRAGFPCARETGYGDGYLDRERYALDASGQLRKKTERLKTAAEEPPLSSNNAEESA